MLSVFKTIFFTICLLLSAEALSKVKYSIKSENIELAKKITNSINLKSNQTVEEIKTKVKNFLIKHSYYTASINLKKQTLSIKDPIKWDFFFEGNSFFSRHFLKKALTKSVFSITSETLVPELEQALIKTYKTAGFHFIKTEASLKNIPKSFISQLTFKIEEAQAVKIQKLSLSGDFGNLKKKELLNKLKRYSGQQISKGIYYDNALKSGLASLKNDLNNLGYFNAYVGLEQLQFNSSKNKVILGVKIYANSPTLLSSVKFTGNSKVSEFWLNELLNLKKNDVLNLYTLEIGLNLIEDYYLQRGFLKVVVEKDDILTYSKDLKTAKINTKIQENPQILVSNIKITGNLKTKRSVVLRELTFKPGEILTADKIKSSSSNLTKLGFFSNIRLKVLFKQTSKNGTPVEIILSERKSGTFTAGFGLSSELDFTVKTFAGFDYKNIKGTGRALTSRVELKRTLRDIDYLENRIFGSYLEPYLFDTPIKGRVNLSRNDEIWAIDSTSDLVTIIQSNRLDFVLETNLTDHTRLFFTPFSLDLRREQVFADNFNDKREEIQEVIGSLNSSIEVDYRNHPFTPTRGSLSKFQIEYASPLFGSNTKSEVDPTDSSNGAIEKVDLEFLKFQTSYTFYRPLSKRFIWAQSFRGGYLKNYSGTKTNNTTPFPKSRAFFLGGATTIRGFDPSKSNERIPDDRYLSENGGILSGGTIGGGVLNIPDSSYYYLTKTELRFPLAKNSSWWGAVFYDAGSVQIASLSERFDSWRHSVGFGVRLNTPVGPLINAEIAYKLDRNTLNNESAVEIHLSVSSF